MPDEIELSPGFFDLNNDIYDDEIEKLIPDKISVENQTPKKNVFLEFIALFIVTPKAECQCTNKDTWSRRYTY
jgi:hypothetical protein